MNVKALIPATLLLGFIGAANAQLSIYGLLDGSVGKSIADDAADQRVDFHSGGDSDSGQGNSTSRFGLKGTTDVGSGIKANFKLESAGISSKGEVGTAAGTPFFNRQAWFGFSGGFGELRFGKQDSVPFQTMIDFDFNGASNGVSAFGYANAAIWGRGREGRSLQYISPVFSGVKVHLGFVPDTSDPTTDEKAHGSVGVTYTLGKLAVAGTFESKRTVTTERFFSVATSYDFGVVKVMAGYADGGRGDTSLVPASTEQTRGFNVGVSVPVAGATVGALAARNQDTKGTAVEVFANKEVLKNTIAYVEAGTVNSKVSTTNKKATGFAVGVIYLF